MDEIEKYIETLTEQEKEVLKIAITMLGSSFDIKKSSGFLKWKILNEN